MKKIFGYTEEQIEKLSKGGEVITLPNSSPIRKGETLEPCIRGAEKILKDKNKREMTCRILRR